MSVFWILSWVRPTTQQRGLAKWLELQTTRPQHTLKRATTMEHHSPESYTSCYNSSTPLDIPYSSMSNCSSFLAVELELESTCIWPSPSPPSFCPWPFNWAPIPLSLLGETGPLKLKAFPISPLLPLLSLPTLVFSNPKAPELEPIGELGKPLEPAAVLLAIVIPLKLPYQKQKGIYRNYWRNSYLVTLRFQLELKIVFQRLRYERVEMMLRREVDLLNTWFESLFEGRASQIEGERDRGRGEFSTNTTEELGWLVGGYELKW